MTPRPRLRSRAAGCPMDLPIPDLPGIDDVPDPLRVLMALGLAGLLVILRFDAERFNAAEYDDIDRWGRKPSLAAAPRLVRCWASAAILVVLKIHPDPVNDLYLGLGDRLGAVVLGLAYGAIGHGDRAGHRALPLPLPSASRRSPLYPGNVPQRDRDGVLRRGGVPRDRCSGSCS